MTASRRPGAPDRELLLPALLRERLPEGHLAHFVAVMQWARQNRWRATGRCGCRGSTAGAASANRSRDSALPLGCLRTARLQAPVAIRRIIE